MGCASLGKPGQRVPSVRYEGDAAVVLVHGYMVPRHGSDGRLETGTQEGSALLNVISYALQKTLEHMPAAWLPYQIAGVHLKMRAYADCATWMQGRLGQYIKSVLLGPGSNPLKRQIDT
jgi:hypothetical protein